MNRGALICLTSLGLLWTASLPTARGDTTAQEVEEDNSLVSGFATPSKPWGRGYVSGPVRTLFFVHSGAYAGDWCDPGTRLREVVELAQRFDLQADAILFGGPAGGKTWDFHGGTFGEKRARRLLARPYSLYVIAGFPLDKLPADLQFTILNQVSQGAGLVCVGPAARDVMTPKRQIQPLPAPLADGLPILLPSNVRQYIQAYQMGQGRGVWLNYPTRALTPTAEFTYQGLAQYDYVMLVLGRAALWAAARDADLSVQFTGTQPVSLQRSAPAASQEVVLTSRVARPLTVQAVFELRRACDGLREPLPTRDLTLNPGEPARLSVALPRLRAGDYLLDIVVRTPRGVEAFGAAAITVASEFGVDKVSIGQEFVERGEAITGKVFLRGAPPVGSTLRIRLRDSYDRVLRQQDFAIAQGSAEYPLEYRTDAAATILMRAEAVLLVGGEEVEMKEASFTVPKRRQDQFNFVQWDAPNDVLGYYAWRHLQEVGMNVCLLGSMGGKRAQPAALRACDASLIPYSTRILDPKDAQGHMQPVCWNHEPAVTEYVNKIVENQRNLRQQGVFVYSLGDEGVTLGCCVHPACLAAYRRYLAEQYGTIDKLNASWGSTYKSFDEVDLLSHKDNMETAALKTAPARWYDRQAFARVNLMRFSGRFLAAYKQLDPTSRTGFEGTGTFGDDYDTLLENLTFYSPYPSIGDDLVRSAAPRDLVRSNWMGYSKTADALSDAAWRMVIKGVDSVWYWMWSGVGSFRGYISPILDFWPATAELAEEMRPVRQGLGDLLLKSKMTHSGIAVFYSVPSAIGHKVTPGTGLADPAATHIAWTDTIYALGMDFRYVTSAMLRRGALDLREFKVLLLPMTQAIRPEEAQAIRRFVEAGGTVVADVRPGILDGHCKPIAPGALDDLFGIRRDKPGKPVQQPVQLHLSLDGRDLDAPLGPALVDPEVQPAAAAALAQAGKTPLVLVNRVGSGRTILLNFQIPPMVIQDRDSRGEVACRILGWLCHVSGVKPVLASTDPIGKPLPLVETRVWDNGGSLVVGLYRRMKCEWFNPKSGTAAGQPVAATVTLAAPRHVYDLRGRKYLGQVSQIDTRLTWGRANFYLVIGYEIPKPEVSVSNPTPAAGQTLTASIRMNLPAGAAERHAVWVEILDPQNQRPLWGRQVVLLEHGAGQVQIPIAYNDLPGTWRVKVTELFSNQSAEAGWTIPQPPAAR